jgi:phosphotransferase system HPr-like phosphotransfer protein
MKIYQKNKKVFTTEKISIIRVGTNKGNYCQVELKEEDSEKLLRIFQCAFNRESWEKQIKY